MLKIKRGYLLSSMVTFPYGNLCDNAIILQLLAKQVPKKEVAPKF